MKKPLDQVFQGRIKGTAATDRVALFENLRDQNGKSRQDIFSGVNF